MVVMGVNRRDDGDGDKIKSIFSGVVVCSEINVMYKWAGRMVRTRGRDAVPDYSLGCWLDNDWRASSKSSFKFEPIPSCGYGN